ncbi:MAG: hypothetical protein QXR53_05045 [Candidatus Norongarragalinales archaeon]
MNYPQTVLLNRGFDSVELIGEIRQKFGSPLANYLNLTINSGTNLHIKITSGALSYTPEDADAAINVNELPERGLFGLMAQVKSDAAKFWENGNGKIEDDFAKFRREDIISGPNLLFEPQVYFDWQRFFKRGLQISENYNEFKTNLLEFNNMQINRKSKKFTGWKCDINAAYWNLANELFLSEKTYKNGLSKKAIRLKALGALATEYRNYWVSASKVVETKIERAQFANLFVYIANSVIDKMQLFSKLNREIFGYYVDCFFIEGENSAEIRYFGELFEQWSGLKLKYEKCDFQFLDNGKHTLLHSISHFEKNEFGQPLEKMYYCQK